MRNPSRRRWAAALLNLLFLLAWGEPVTLRPCPMHDGVAVAGAAAHGHHGEGGSPAAAHGAHALPAPAPAAPAHDGGAHACQCLGACSAASAVALPGTVAVAWQATVRHAAEPAPAEPVAPSAAAPRLLPFANGPPSLA